MGYNTMSISKEAWLRAAGFTGVDAPPPLPSDFVLPPFTDLDIRLMMASFYALRKLLYPEESLDTTSSDDYDGPMTTCLQTVNHMGGLHLCTLLTGHEGDCDPSLSDPITDEIEDLRAMIRKLRRSVGWWAALSFVDGVHGGNSRWTEAERALLHRAGL